jgi:hypothetical protein
MFLPLEKVTDGYGKSGSITRSKIKYAITRSTVSLLATNMPQNDFLVYPREISYLKSLIINDLGLSVKKSYGKPWLSCASFEDEDAVARTTNSCTSTEFRPVQHPNEEYCAYFLAITVI